MPFRLFILLLLAGGVAYLIRLVKHRQMRMEREMRMEHELLSVNLEREKERQIRMERENFFTSAAHELRTPLTLILAPLQELLEHIKASDPLYSKLYTMYKNSSSLHTLVDQLLYVQKIEAGMVETAFVRSGYCGASERSSRVFSPNGRDKRMYISGKTSGRSCFPMDRYGENNFVGRKSTI